MIIKNARIFNNNKEFRHGDIFIEGEKIKEISFDGEDMDGGKTAADGGEEIIDASDLYAIPGLVDIHFHGAMGHDFCDADLEGLKEIARYEASNGVTAICPATMTFSEEILGKIMSVAKDYEANCNYQCKDLATLVGINMEGPFISENKIGAQNPKYLQKPDASMFERLQEKSGGLIKLLDIAPEVPGAMEFIDKCKDIVNISIAHTDADFETADKAFKTGARHVTHLYNAMNPIHHRKPGPIIAALENDAEVELIADGVHIDQAMVRFTFNSFNKDKVILISDSMEATGLSDGEYQLGGQPVIKKGKLATLKDSEGTVAGSVTNLFDCMKTAVKDMGVRLEDAVAAATINPARAIGIDDSFGSIESGKYADIMLIDQDLNLRHVIKKGICPFA